MSTLIKTEIPDQLWQQAQNMVDQGWMRRYIESHQQTISERFIREDIEWGLHGKD